MANSYNQLYVQIVFVVKYRETLVTKKIKDRVEKYITGIVQSHNQKLMAIYCNPDHLHMLVSLDAKMAISDLVREIKANSSKFINQEKLVPGVFRWQEGYGSFSYSKKEVPRVAAYIENQEAHHQKKNFREEYLELLREREVEYDERYLFDFLD